MAFGLRDHEGALWLPAYAKGITPSPFPRGSPQYLANPPRRENRSIRILDNGPLEELPLDAWPFLIDGSDNVWLAEMKNGRPFSRFWVWRHGQVLQELTIPGAQEMRTICSDKPGSVYVGTSLGLHHLVTERGTAAEKPFRLEHTYALPRVLPNQFSCPHSDLAGLVVTETKAVTFIALPKP